MRKRNGVGRPRTLKARFFIGRHTTHLWLSKGAVAILGMPTHVNVERKSNEHIDEYGAYIYEVQPSLDKEGLSVSQTGYMSGDKLWNTLEEEMLPQYTEFTVQQAGTGKRVWLVPVLKSEVK